MPEFAQGEGGAVEVRYQATIRPGLEAVLERARFTDTGHLHPNPSCRVRQYGIQIGRILAPGLEDLTTSVTSRVRWSERPSKFIAGNVLPRQTSSYNRFHRLH